MQVGRAFKRVMTVALSMIAVEASAGWVSSGKTSDQQKTKALADFKPGELKGLPCPEPKQGEKLEDLIQKTHCQPVPEKK